MSVFTLSKNYYASCSAGIISILNILTHEYLYTQVSP
jgi:hypothetical protein